MNKRLLTRLTIGCVILLLVLGGLDYWVVDDLSPLQDYIRGTVTETVGILITLLLVDRLIRMNQEKVDRTQEAEGLLNADRVISLYIRRIHIYTAQVVTPLSKRPRDKVLMRCPETWGFTDMRDLFTPSLIDIDGQVPVVLKCLQSIGELKRASETLVTQLSLRHFPHMVDLLLQMVESMGPLDLYEGIKFDSVATLGEGKQKDFVKQMIIQHTGPPQYPPSNVMNKYTALHHGLLQFIELIGRYEVEIAKIRTLA